MMLRAVLLKKEGMKSRILLVDEPTGLLMEPVGSIDMMKKLGVEIEYIEEGEECSEPSEKK